MTTKMRAPFRGVSRLSKLYDLLVVTHTGVAFLFATALLVYPNIFAIFLQNSDAYTPVMGDSIRWCSPFVFGFSGFALLSLYLPAPNRRQVAAVFACAFLLATVIGSITQTNGRWNSLHPFNIALFGFLAVQYIVFVVYPVGLQRTGTPLLKDPVD